MIDGGAGLQWVRRNQRSKLGVAIDAFLCD
jgi:hypothetical protein